MRRWRTVGRIGLATGDGRVILEPRLPDGPVPIVLPGRTGLEKRGEAEVRIRENRIEALLPYRYRDSTPSFGGGKVYADSDAEPSFSIVVYGATVRALGPGPSAWSKAALR